MGQGAAAGQVNDAGEHQDQEEGDLRDAGHHFWIRLQRLSAGKSETSAAPSVKADLARVSSQPHRRRRLNSERQETDGENEV